MTFEEQYKLLNKEQKKAVDTIDGPLLVIAGPGSGKTQILSMRVGKILKESQILASNILCLTFTESASVNMRIRLASLIGGEAYRTAIHTFHNFCVEIIQKYPEYFYSGAFFSPADELTQIQILQEIFEKLPQRNPLRSEHPEQGFVFLRDSLKIIGYLKKAGILPEEFRKIIKNNQKILPEINSILEKAFIDRLSNGSIDKISKAVEEISLLSEKNIKDKDSSILYNLIEAIKITLEKAVSLANEIDKTSPLSAWKEKWLKKDDKNKPIFKDTTNIEKLLVLSDIYEKYRNTMHENGYYDFDDMILDTIGALENNPSLRYQIQEQYQYILVDEFQDTNDAQMRLLELITDAPVHEGHPNIMAVGDNDQAVYKFQGAGPSNFDDFKKLYKDVQVVAMIQNYRSTQDILDIATHIIKKGEERLENILPEIEKVLIASNPKIKEGDIKHKEFATIAHEYHFVSREIKKRIDEGMKPEEIAVIARKHFQLEELVPYLRGAGVPIRYEREQNVFKEPHIAQLIILARFLFSISGKNKDEADEFLPQILSFPFWELDRETIWKISLNARRGDHDKNWLEVMLDADPIKFSSEGKLERASKISDIAKFLIDLGTRSKNEPLEKILDEMVGAHLPVSQEGEDDDGESMSNEYEYKEDKKFSSPFKQFYFSREKFEHSRAEYLQFLSSLRVFVNALREYKSGQILSLNDLIEFVDLHEKNNISLNDQSPFAKFGEAVSLLTAHKAKGLEFETVFVLSCQDDIWAGRGIPSKISLPANLPIGPAGDTEDDQLRLFYVAITRAKRHLYLTSYLLGEKGETAQKLRFLVSGEDNEEITKHKALKKLYNVELSEKDEVPETHDVLTASWLKYHTPPFFGAEKKLLQSLLDNYKMPVTHLNNFLNIKKGGPQFFLEQNLLRFPQSKTPSGAYGSAMHKTLENIVLYLKKEGNIPNENLILESFEKFLKRERLVPNDFEQYKERGIESLTAFLKEKKGEFNAKDIVEFNFKEQGVKVAGAEITGKIDRIIDFGGGQFEVYDFKTGKAPKNDWTGKDDYEKIKLYEYERQLIFYKLLVENSREFGGRSSRTDSGLGAAKVERGILEFIEPRESDKKIITLPLIITKEKTEKMAQLIGKVYEKIMNLDLPDVSKYSQDLKGIQQFEEDLLEGKI
jgi:DNA helicase-2/ATP-dependent DNA helicase PcrA